MMTILNIM